MEKQYIRIKEGLDINDLLFLDPTILKMLAFISEYTSEYDLPFLITSLREDAPGRKHNTHKEGRAVDLSVRDWSNFHIQTLLFKFKKKFKGRGAYNSSGENRPIVYHKTEHGAYHFHIQTHPRRGHGEGTKG